MKRYAPNALELASRDVVSRSEQTEIDEGRGLNGNVLLDMRHLGAERIIYSEDFPYVKRDNVAEFLTSASLSGPQMHAIAHGNAEALLRI